MVLAIKHRTIYYRRFAKDIWGIMRTTAPQLGVNKYLSYKLTHGQIPQAQKNLIVKYQQLQRLQLPEYLTPNTNLFSNSSNNMRRILDFFFTLYIAKKKAR